MADEQPSPKMWPFYALMGGLACLFLWPCLSHIRHHESNAAFIVVGTKIKTSTAAYFEEVGRYPRDHRELEPYLRANLEDTFIDLATCDDRSFVVTVKWESDYVPFLVTYPVGEDGEFEQPYIQMKNCADLTD